MRKLVSMAALMAAFTVNAAEPIAFPTEVGALLASPAYGRTLEQARSTLPAGMTLNVSGASIDSIGGETLVYVHLTQEIHSGVQTKILPHGNIVGSLRYGPQRQVYVFDVYFAPAAQPAQP